VLYRVIDEHRCGGRRMTEGAARLVDGILPHVPVRQWVLSLPHRLRYLIAWDHKLCRAVLCARVLLSFQRRRAAPRPSRRPLGLRDGHSAVRGRAQPERPLPHAGPRRRIGPCHRRRTRRSAPSSQRSTCGCAASCAVRASTRLPPISHARIRSRRNHRCSRALAALRSRAGSRSGPARGGVCGRWGKSRTRHGCCRATRGTRTSRASISTRMSPYRLPTAGAWSNSVAICCARPSRKSGCGGWATTASCSR